MTTKAAEQMYLAQHLMEWAGKGYVVFNPHNKPIEELPVIYGFNNGGNSWLLSAVAMAEDGTVLGGHGCSNEGYMPHDLGIIDGARPDRHEESYKKHYPDGYRMDFVSYDDIPNHAALQAAFRKNQETDKAATPEPA